MTEAAFVKMGVADEMGMRCRCERQRGGTRTRRNADVLYLMARQRLEDQRRPAAIEDGNGHK